MSSAPLMKARLSFLFVQRWETVSETCSCTPWAFCIVFEADQWHCHVGANDPPYAFAPYCRSHYFLTAGLPIVCLDFLLRLCALAKRLSKRAFLAVQKDRHSPLFAFASLLEQGRKPQSQPWCSLVLPLPRLQIVQCLSDSAHFLACISHFSLPSSAGNYQLLHPTAKSLNSESQHWFSILNCFFDSPTFEANNTTPAATTVRAPLVAGSLSTSNFRLSNVQVLSVLSNIACSLLALYGYWYSYCRWLCERR